MTDPGPARDFGSTYLENFKVVLLRTILRKYGMVDRPTRSRIRPRPPDPTVAFLAADCESGGVLLRMACDVWDIALGELANRAGLDQIVLSTYIMERTPMSWEETRSVSSAMGAIVQERTQAR